MNDINANDLITFIFTQWIFSTVVVSMNIEKLNQALRTRGDLLLKLNEAKLAESNSLEHSFLIKGRREIRKPAREQAVFDFENCHLVI